MRSQEEPGGRGISQPEVFGRLLFLAPSRSPGPAKPSGRLVRNL